MLIEMLYQPHTPLEQVRENNLNRIYLNHCRQERLPAVFVITTAARQSKGLLDFLHVYERENPGQCALVRMNQETGERALAIALITLANYQVRQGDYVVVVRGGGDTQHTSFAAFHSRAADRQLQFMQRGKVRLVMGIGHSTDHFHVEQFASHLCITPTEAGYCMNQLMQEERLKTLI